jgi:hypothetical protein
MVSRVRVADVIRVRGAVGEKTWRLVLSCGHFVDVVSRSKTPGRGMPTRRIHPCVECLAGRISRVPDDKL